MLVDFLLGNANVEQRPLPVYSDEAVAFLSDLSKALMNDPETRSYPDVVSFGYWCRKANVMKRKQQLNGIGEACFRVGRGLAFHVAPSNVPVNFAFSFVFSLLAGNANIVRVPSKPFKQVEFILRSIRGLLKKHPEIGKRTAFVSYPSSSEATKAFSACADVRIIWGGDQTVAEVRLCPSKPRCKDIVFSDRYSFAFINGKELESVPGDVMRRIARDFYNDTYLMDQNACSSPHMIIWKGADDAIKASFWKAVENVAEFEYDLQPAVVMDKYVQLCEDAIRGNVIEGIEFNGLLVAVNLESLPENVEQLRGKGGYFYQIDDVELHDFALLVSEKTQTLTYYGFTAHELGELIQSLGSFGIDRIVPIGAAMDIDIIWDGYDLVGEMSRIIDIR